MGGTKPETSSFGLPVVSEESAGGVETSLGRNGSMIMEEPAEYGGGTGDVPEGMANTGSDQVLAGEQATTSGQASAISTDAPELAGHGRQPDSVRIDSSERAPTLNPTVKHPDPTHRPPSPPPRASDTEPLTPNTASTGTSSPPPTTPITSTAEDDHDSVSSDVEAFFDAEMKWDEREIEPLSLPQDPGKVPQVKETSEGGRKDMTRRASVDSGVTADQAGRAGDRESAVLGFQRKMVDVGKKFSFGA